jgi:hypothetical protein
LADDRWNAAKLTERTLGQSNMMEQARKLPRPSFWPRPTTRVTTRRRDHRLSWISIGRRTTSRSALLHGRPHRHKRPLEEVMPSGCEFALPCVCPGWGSLAADKCAVDFEDYQTTCVDISATLSNTRWSPVPEHLAFAEKGSMSLRQTAHLGRRRRPSPRAPYSKTHIRCYRR